MSSSMSDLSDSPPPKPRRHQVDSDDDDDDAPTPAQSESPPPKPAPKALDDMFSDDDDEDEAPKSRPARRQATPDGSDDGLKDDGSDMGDDLFGEDSDKDMDDAGPPKKTLDDEELDSADDLDADPSRRTGGNMFDDDLSEEERDETSYEVDIGLHRLPKSSDDEVFLLKIPQFISIAPQVFKPETFQAPKLPPDAAITPYTFATTAVRWRRNPKNPSELQSNSRIIEWSDGSYSLQIGSAQDGIYDLPTNPLIPPKEKEYNPALDSFTFLAEPLANSRLVRFFTHATQSMAVVPASDNIITDDIKQMVAARYKATQKRRVETGGAKQVELSYKIEDPERARREAEAAEREAEKFRKKIEAQKMKEQDQNGYRRSRGFGGRREAGLTLDDLEEREYEKPERRSGGGGGGYRGRRDKEDDYDEDDGFVEADPDSDEEEDIIDDSEEEEEYESSRRKEKKKNKEKEKRRKERDEEELSEPEAEFTEGESDAAPSRAKSPSKPKARSASDVDEDDDDEGELAQARERKRRRLVMVDSDEE